MLLSCDGDSSHQNDRDPNAIDSGNQSGAKTDSRAGDDSPPEPPLQQTFTVTGDEPQNAYTSLVTVMVIPRALSRTTLKKSRERTALLSGLAAYKTQGTQLGSTPTTAASKLYCFEKFGDQTSTNRIPIAKPAYVDQSYPCAFMLNHLDPYTTPSSDGQPPTTIKSMHFMRGHNSEHFHKPKVIAAGADQPNYIHTYGRIKEAYRLFVVLDTLKYFDNLSPAKQVFKPQNDLPTPLKVMIQLAYTDIAATDTDSTEPTAKVVQQRLQATYPNTDMQSFLFFALTAGSQPNYQAIATTLGGRTFLVLDQSPASGEPHPVSTAMKTITALIAGYAQGKAFQVSKPIATVEAVGLDGTPLEPQDYLFRGTTLYVLKQLDQDDVIKVTYRAQS